MELPVMRVAVLADIHGNLPALEAVLAEVEAEAAHAVVDAIVLNGDLADGPMPAQTLDRLEALGERAVWVRGNADRDLAGAFDGSYQPTGLSTNAPPEWFAWCAARLERRHRDRLAGLPLSVTLDVDGLGPVRFCHGTARDDNEFLLVDSPVQQYRDAFAGVTEPTVVLGHTHMPFDRLAGGRRFVNPGSVGMAYGHSGAAWALLGPDVTLRRTAYDTEAAAAAVRAAAPGLPGIEDLAANILAPASDAEALEAFTGTVREQAARRSRQAPDPPRG
jgi:predicted phosphodiesterase